MHVWVRTELLCIHFDGLKVKFDQWPIPLSTFQAMLIDRALEHFEDSNCLFVQEELNRFKNQARKVASLLRRRCRLFKKVDSEHPTEVTNLRNVEWDDEIYLSLGDWDGGYDTELVSTDDSDEDEIDSWLGWLLEEWDTDDVAFWLEKNGLNTFTQGFRDQKIDGLCLMEGLSENELQLCQVRTVGEKRTLQRKISELVGHSKLKVPKLTKKSVKPLAPEQKEDLLRRKKQVHRKTVLKFPGNKIPIIRGNPEAKRKIEELVDDCRQLINPDLGYDEDELRRHLRAILDERRRMVKEGYNYEEKSSTDESKEKSSNDEISCNEEFNSDHEKSSADVSELLEEPAELPGSADSVPLSTAETIILVYFGKGYTKEVKKDKHLIPLCREFQLKNIKSKEKNDLIMLLAKQLLTRKKVTLEKNADFYCLHRDSVIVQ